MANSQIGLWQVLESLGRYSSLWTGFLTQAPRELVEAFDPEDTPWEDRELARAIKKEYSQISHSECLAFIDYFNGSIIRGWAYDPELGQSPKLALLIDGQMVAQGFSATLERADVANAGVGTGSCGFELPVPEMVFSAPWCIAKLLNAANGEVLAIKFFNLCRTLPVERLEKDCRILLARQAWANALALASAAGLKFPDQPAFQQIAAQASESLGDFEKAEFYWKAAKDLAEEHVLQYALLPMRNGIFERRAACRMSLERIYQNKCVPRNSTEINQINSIFQTLLEDGHDPILMIIYNNFLNCAVLGKSDAYMNFMRKRILCIFLGQITLEYNLHWLEYMPPMITDIYIKDNQNYKTDSINVNESYSYKICYEFPNMMDYGIIVIDRFLYISDVEINNSIANNRKILLGHSTSCCAAPNNGGLDIVTSSVLCSVPWLFQTKDMSEKVLDSFINLPQHAKTEVSVTGPYHLGKYLDKKYHDKTRLRKELEERLGVAIPADKPLVLCMQGTFDMPGQLAVGLNKLAESCTIILKTFFSNRSPWLKNLKKEIIIYNSVYQAPTLPRMAADYVLCAFYSGTFISCLMQGLQVIPFYTRILLRRDQDFKPEFYTDFMQNYLQNPDCNPIFYKAFEYWPKFFDILQTNRITEAILSGDYAEWYKDNLPELREKIVGDYTLQGADLKTAEYILRFASEGSLGRDCAAFGLS